jgi:hypothetical protein
VDLLRYAPCGSRAVLQVRLRGPRSRTLHLQALTATRDESSGEARSYVVVA